MSHVTARASRAVGGGCAKNQRLQNAAWYVALQAAVIVAAGLIAYMPAMRAGFVWDDDSFLTHNPLIHADDGLRRFWLSTEAPDYFPMVSSMLWFEWRLWGDEPAGYHVVNILLHVAGGLLVWRVLERLGVPGAWLAGLIFAVHPVTVQSVAWITERKNTLSMFFYLLTLLLYVRFESRPTRSAYAAALVCFLLAALSKTSVVMLPAVLLLMAWWQRGRIGRPDILRTVPFFAVSAVLGGVTLWFQYHRAIGEDLVRGDGAAARLAAAGCAVWFYLYKLLVPIHLSAVYPRWRIDPAAVLAWVPLFAAIVCLVLLWRCRRWVGRGPFAAFAYFVLSLIPVLGMADIYFMRYSLVSDHWQYVAMAGPIALMAAGIARAVIALPRRGSIAIAGAAAMAIAMLAAQTWRQCGVYESRETLWRDTLAKNPACWLAHNNLGVLLSGRGEITEARRHYETAIDLRRDYVEAHTNLGLLLAREGRTTEAMRSYRQALATKPTHAPAMFNHAMLLDRTGDLSAAAEQYAEALRCEPNLPEAHFRLGTIHLRQGRPDEAMAAFQSELRLNPDHAGARNNLANLLIQQNRLEEAEVHLRRALRIKPGYAEAYFNLGVLLTRRKQPGPAIDALSRGLKLKPDANMHLLLARLLVSCGRGEEAATHFSAATRLAPDLADAYAGLAAIRAGQGKWDEAIDLYRQALQREPNSDSFANNLAWLLATHPDESRRRPDEAAALIESLLDADEPAEAAHLDTLAAAQAAQGRFDRAVETARQAAELAETDGRTAMAADILERAALYESDKSCAAPH